MPHFKPQLQIRQLEVSRLTPAAAIRIQNELRTHVKIQPFQKTLKTIGGADISFNRFSTTAYAVFVVLDASSLNLVSRSYFVGELEFPYIPGLLSFREIPLLLEAWDRLEIKPDLMMMDGQGIAHPRRLGIASHFGVLTHSPTIGCAKSKLIGEFEEPTNEAGAYTPLCIEDEEVGVAYRTKRNTNPIFISPGHLMDVSSILTVMKRLKGKYRIPEPTRQAHIYANEIRLKALH